jgi:nucleotide-binding universal stress UspA family protein
MEAIMYRDVLVPLDGSASSERALAYGVPLARSAGATLHLLLVHEPIARYAVEIAPSRLIDGWESQQRGREGRYVERRALAVRAVGVAAETELYEGDVADELARRAASAADLMVLSTRVRGGVERLWSQSVADHLIRRVRLPLLLVPPAAAGAPASPGDEVVPRHILAATDGSPAAAAAVAEATRLARLFDARLTLVRAVSPTGALGPLGPGGPEVAHGAPLSLETVARREASAKRFVDEVAATIDVPARGRVVRASHAARGILDLAVEVGADLVAVGAARRSRFARAVLGSVADEVVRASPVPVLVAHGAEAGG